MSPNTRVPMRTPDTRTRVPGARVAAWVLAGAALVTGLSACAPLVVGGAMVGGAMVAVDRRTAGAQLEDKGIELNTRSQVRQALGDGTHVNVNSYNRLVLLTGEVRSEEDRARAERITNRVENVRAVVNELAVMGPSSLTSRSNDTFITGRVKATFVDARDLAASAISVTTERGNVYLMGIVTEREATRAAELARSVPGVSRVIRVFEVVTEEELARIVPRRGATEQPATPASSNDRPM